MDDDDEGDDDMIDMMIVPLTSVVQQNLALRT